MLSDPITSWQIEGEGGSTDRFPLVSKVTQMVTAAMKSRHLLLGRKAMTNLDSILKNRELLC